MMFYDVYEAGQAGSLKQWLRLQSVYTEFRAFCKSVGHSDGYRDSVLWVLMKALWSVIHVLSRLIILIPIALFFVAGRNMLFGFDRP